MLESIIKEPILTEKSSAERGQNKYFFKVQKNANKNEIKKAVEQLFKVKVLDVNTMKVNGKKRRQGRLEGKTKDWKKAMVTLKEGQVIEALSV